MKVYLDVIDQFANPLAWLAVVCAPLPLFSDTRKWQVNKNTILICNYCIEKLCETSESSLVSAEISGYPIYECGCSFPHIWYAWEKNDWCLVLWCSAWMGKVILADQERQGISFKALYACLAVGYQWPLWMHLIVKYVFPSKSGVPWMLCKSLTIDATVQCWRNCILMEKLFSICSL